MRKAYPQQVSEGVWLTPRFKTFVLQNCGTINFYCCKPPHFRYQNLYSFVRTVVTKVPQIGWLRSSLCVLRIRKINWNSANHILPSLYHYPPYPCSSSPSILQCSSQLLGVNADCVIAPLRWRGSGSWLSVPAKASCHSFQFHHSLASC